MEQRNKPTAWMIYRGHNGNLRKLINDALATYERNYGHRPPYIRVSNHLVQAAAECTPEGTEIMGNGGTLIGEVELPLYEVRKL